MRLHHNEAINGRGSFGLMAGIKMSGANYLIVVSDIPNQASVTRALDIARFLFAQDTWVFPEYANTHKLRLGDRLIVYIARPTSAFVAQATIGSEPSPIDGKLRTELNRLGLVWFTRQVKINAKKILVPPMPIKPMIPRLHFVTDKKNYGLALRQGLRRLPPEDAELILRRSGKI